MNDLSASVPSMLPDILAAACLVLLGISFIRRRIRYRNEERRLRDAIRSLSGAESAADNTEESAVRPGKGEI